MLDTTDDILRSNTDAVSTTVWIENEIRRIHQERDAWHARWMVLKTWLSKRRNAHDWTTIGMIERRMEELELDTPTLPLTALTYTLIEEE